MDALLDEPAIVLIVLTLAAALFIVEVALPTAGVAGTLALVLGLTAVAGISEQDADWWPLIGPKAGRDPVGRDDRPAAAVPRSRECCRPAVRRRQRGLFGVLADSPLTAVIGGALAVPLGAGFPRLHERARALLDQPARVGMEAQVGSQAVGRALEGRDRHGPTRRLPLERHLLPLAAGGRPRVHRRPPRHDPRGRAAVPDPAP